MARNRSRSLRGKPIPAKKRQAVAARSGGRCELVIDNSRCTNQADEIQHALPRGRGGYLLDAVPDETYHLVHLCRPHHRWTEQERSLAYSGRSAHGTPVLILGDVNWDKIAQRPVYRGTDPYLSKEYPDGSR